MMPQQPGQLMIQQQPIVVKDFNEITKKFSSGIEEYMAFRERFLVLVHRKPLSDEHKFQILLDSLEGDAFNLLAEFGQCGTAYHDALARLDETFGSPADIKEYYTQKIQNMKNVTDHESLKQLYYQAQASNLQLTRLQVPTDGLVNIITMKISGTYRININNMSPIELTGMNMEQLLDSLKRQIRITKPPTEFSHGASGSDPVTYHVSSLAATSNYECVFCGLGHRSYMCRKVPNAMERREIIKDKHLCFNCFSHHNDYRYGCPKFDRNNPNTGCKICHRGHHSSLHDAFNQKHWHTCDPNEATDDDTNSEEDTDSENEE